MSSKQIKSEGGEKIRKKRDKKH